jgi:hypothetical protein
MVLTRVAARLVTSRAAFFVSGVIDVCVAIGLGLRFLARTTIGRR